MKLTTDEGLTGISEYNKGYGSLGPTGVIEKLVPLILGSDPRAHERLVQQLYAKTRQAPGGIKQQVIAAIENPLVDLKACSLGVSVYELLGGAIRDHLQLYWSHCGSRRLGAESAEAVGKPQIRGLQDLVALGREVREQGFQALKTTIFVFGDVPFFIVPGTESTPGWPELNADQSLIEGLRAQLRAFREGAGAEVGIHLDLNFNFKTEGLFAGGPRPR